MAYTIGTAHGPFTGTGSFVIAKPVGIRSIVSNIPARTGHDESSPRRYFRLGRFSLGNVHGFENSRDLEYSQQLVYPIPPVWELLAYDIRDGASCTFYELVDVVDLTLKQPWDRTPSVLSRTAFPTSSGTAAESVAFTYTVPTGRKLLLSNCSAFVYISTMPTALTNVYASIKRGSDYILSANLRLYTGPNVARDSIEGGSLLLLSGEVISGVYASTMTGGVCQYAFSISGVLFDS